MKKKARRGSELPSDGVGGWEISIYFQLSLAERNPMVLVTWVNARAVT